MSPFPQVCQFLVVAVAGWINQQQRDVIDWCLRHSLLIRQPICVRAATRTMTARLG